MLQRGVAQRGAGNRGADSGAGNRGAHYGADRGPHGGCHGGADRGPHRGNAGGMDAKRPFQGFRPDGRGSDGVHPWAER